MKSHIRNLSHFTSSARVFATGTQAGRKLLFSLRSQSWRPIIVLGLVLFVGMETRAFSATATEASAWSGTYVDRRIPASLAFPRYRATSDTGDILREYPAYLKFVLEIGKRVDSGTAKRLASTYDALRRRDPEGAARFLKGLRFEMVYKLELMGVSERSINTSNNKIRGWVAKYLPLWYREADEGLLRSRIRRKT